MGLLDPLYWESVNNKLAGLLGQPVERANELAGLLSGTVPPRNFLALRAKQVAESMQPEEIMNNFAGSGMLGPTVYHGTTRAFDGPLRGKPGGLKMMDGLGPHLGTAEAANERLLKNAGAKPNAWNKPIPEAGSPLDGANIRPYDLTPQKPFVKSDGNPYTESELQSRLSGIAQKLGFAKTDTRRMSQWGSGGKLQSAQIAVKNHLREQGYDAIPYINSHEARGSTSWVVLDDDALKGLFAP